jgi:hypothetical protein
VELLQLLVGSQGQAYIDHYATTRNSVHE